jgi:hypothetical protein
MRASLANPEPQLKALFDLVTDCMKWGCSHGRSTTTGAMDQQCEARISPRLARCREMRRLLVTASTSRVRTVAIL